MSVSVGEGPKQLLSASMPQFPAEWWGLLLRVSGSALLLIGLACAAYGQQSPSASLHGTVRDSDGKPVVDAVVELGAKTSSERGTTRTDGSGSYAFSQLNGGVYSLRVTKSSYADAEVDSVFLAKDDKRAIDLLLVPAKKAQLTISNPQFFDQPRFTVSGITDATNLGGHGSDTVVRAREAVAEETVTLGRPSPSASSDASGSEESLRERAESIRVQLIQHDEPDLHHQLGDIEERLGDSLEAVHQYQRAAEMASSEPYLFDWGAELLLHHAPEPASEVFTKGNRLFPNSTRMLIGLGAALMTAGKNEDAVRRVCEASDLNPKDPTPYHFLGEMLRAESTPSPDLVRRLHRFVTLHPDNAEANYYYAAALGKSRDRASEKDRIAEEESLLTNAVHLEPKYAAAYLQMGIVHAKQGKNEVAVSDYQQAIRIDTELEEAHFRLAQAYRKLGQNDKSTDEFQIYEQLVKASAERAERERHEIRQFVYTLRDQSTAH